MAGKDTPNPIPEQPKRRFELHRGDLFIPGETHQQIAPEDVDWANEVPVKFYFHELGVTDAHEVISDPSVAEAIANARKMMAQTPGRRLRVVVVDEGPYVEDIDTGEYVEEDFSYRSDRLGPLDHMPGYYEALAKAEELDEAEEKWSELKKELAVRLGTIAVVYAITFSVRWIWAKKKDVNFWTGK